MLKILEDVNSAIHALLSEVIKTAILIQAREAKMEGVLFKDLFRKASGLGNYTDETIYRAIKDVSKSSVSGRTAKLCNPHVLDEEWVSKMGDELQLPPGEPIFYNRRVASSTGASITHRCARLPCAVLDI